MSSLRPPVIPCNATTNLRPDLIGLAAWLCCNDYNHHTRGKILKHAGENGTLDGLERQAFVFDSPEDFEMAKVAYAEGKLLVVEEVSAPPRPLHPSLTALLERVDARERNGNLDRRLAELKTDPCGVNGQENPDDVAF